MLIQSVRNNNTNIISTLDYSFGFTQKIGMMLNNNHNNSKIRNLFFSAISIKLFFHADCSVYTEPCALSHNCFRAAPYCIDLSLHCQLKQDFGYWERDGGCWVKGGGVGNWSLRDWKAETRTIFLQGHGLPRKSPAYYSTSGDYTSTRWHSQAHISFHITFSHLMKPVTFP